LDPARVLRACAILSIIQARPVVDGTTLTGRPDDVLVIDRVLHPDEN
jgi:hypothetical protein